MFSLTLFQCTDFISVLYTFCRSSIRFYTYFVDFIHIFVGLFHSIYRQLTFFQTALSNSGYSMAGLEKRSWNGLETVLKIWPQKLINRHCEIHPHEKFVPLNYFYNFSFISRLFLVQDWFFFIKLSCVKIHRFFGGTCCVSEVAYSWTGSIKASRYVVKTVPKRGTKSRCFSVSDRKWRSASRVIPEVITGFKTIGTKVQKYWVWDFKMWLKINRWKWDSKGWLEMILEM